MDDSGRSPCLDVCLVSARPDGLSDLERWLRESGCRPVVTTPARLPEDAEWEAYDVVLVHWDPRGSFPEIPARTANLVLAVGPRGELENPALLRAALRAGARELLPETPEHPGWKDLLLSVRTAAPQAAVRFLDPGSGVERWHRLERDVTTLGRDPACDVVFALPFISRMHARITRSGSRYRIADANSTMGTLVNGVPVSGRLLVEGDRIQLGGDSGPVLTFTTITVPEGTLRLETTGILDRSSVNREVHDIAALLESFLSLDSDLLLEEVLELLLDRMIAFVNAERGVVLLRPWQDGPPGMAALDALKLGCARHRSGRTIPEPELDLNYRLLGEVLKSGRGAVEEELLDPPATLGETVPANGVRSSMCVPLKLRGKLLGNRVGPTVIGLLYVDSGARAKPFSPPTLNALEVFAAEAAMAVHTTRLYEDSLRRRRVEEELDIAREIQRNIFHEQRHDGPVWQVHGTTTPSYEVGGDFLGCFELAPERLCVVVGDVSGKGVPAALFSTMLDGLFHGLADFQEADPDLADAAVKLNRYILAKSRLKKFVTSIFGVLEPDGRFRYVNSGHNPGLILRADGTREELESGGTILGMFEDVTYRSHVVAIEPGDVLFLYSDGVTDSRNPAGEALGIARLAETLDAIHAREPARPATAASYHAAVLESVTAFLDGAPPRDDVTLMVVRRV